MAIEIEILSGARQGQQIYLDAKQFRAGSEAGCEVYFDPAGHPTVGNRVAWFFLQPDGWYVKRSGTGEILINVEPVRHATRLRSADVVRMSDQGPDLVFRIVNRPSAHSGTPVMPPEPPAPAPQPPVDPRAPVATQGPVGDGIAPRAGRAADTPSVAQPASGQPAPLSAVGGNRALWLGGGAVAVCMLLFLVLQRPSVTVVVPSPPPPNDSNRPPATPSGSTTAVATRSGAGTTSPQPPPGPPEPPPKPPSPPADSWAQAAAALKDSVYMLQAENRGGRLPHATCFAVGTDTLLTTGREANQLAQLHDEKKFKIYAVQDSSRAKLEIRDMHVYAVLLTGVGEKSSDAWMYYDLVLLTVDGTLPKPVPLASAEDLSQLEEGLPLACFGYTHDAGKITRFDHFEPQLWKLKVYMITSPPALPGHPRLLHLRGEIGQNAYGSPVLNERGKVVGIYVDPGGAEPGKESSAPSVSLKNLHYATVLNPELIRRWTEDHDTKLWLSPSAAPKPAGKR